MTEPERDEEHGRTSGDDNRLGRIVGDKATRRIRARSNKKTSVWFGLGMYGVIGWSIAVPTLVGIAVGLALDALIPASFSWALTLLFAGLILGLHSAWRWISQEMEEDRRDRPGDEE